MLVTVIATFVAATFILAPEDFIGFAKSCIGAAFSVSNFVFLAEAGYWDTASELKPLLHTWSLGVEEQFYLIWPALLILVHRFVSFDRRWLVYLALTVFGVWFSAFGLQSNPSAAFYLTPFRIFEFSMGALIAHVSYMRVWKRLSENVLICEGLFIAGFSMIIFVSLSIKGPRRFLGIMPFCHVLVRCSYCYQGPLNSSKDRLVAWCFVIRSAAGWGRYLIRLIWCTGRLSPSIAMSCTKNPIWLRKY